MAASEINPFSCQARGTREVSPGTLVGVTGVYFSTNSRVGQCPIRGGKLALDDASAEDDPNLGTDTELIIGLRNAFDAFFMADNGLWQAVLDKYRTDY